MKLRKLYETFLEYFKKVIKEKSIHDIIFFNIIIFPISTILQGFSFFNNINKIFTGIIILLIVTSIIKDRLYINTFFVLTATVIIYISSFINTKNTLYNLNDIFYFAFWILYFIYQKNYINIFKELIYKNKNLIKRIVVIWNLIVFISLFFQRSYSTNWGGYRYFHSFSNGEHRFASVCIFVLSLVWILVQTTDENRYIMYGILPIIGIYMTGARIYLVIVLIYIICIYYMIFKTKRIFYITFIPIIVLLIMLVFMTPMGSKIMSTLEFGYGGFWRSITNSRSVFWVADIKAFLNSNLFKKLIGNGFNYIYEINIEAVGTAIWAHNDFINILISFGLLGVFLYLQVFLNYTQTVKKRNNRISKPLEYGFYAIWLFNAMFNMVYTYFCSTLVIPFILFSFYTNENKIKPIKETNF